MAKSLNKSRLRDTNIVLLVSFLLIILTRQVNGKDDDDIHECIEFVGYFFTMIAALGRLYCTAFLGGFKNRRVIDHGPFSVCRNPLYLFSLIGVFGIALMTVNLLVLIILPTCVLLIYISLIKREEVYLTDKFGEEYITYKQKTPCLIPNFKLYHAPDTIEMTPRTIRNAFRDSIMWLLAYPLVELIEYLQDEHYIVPLLYMHL